MKTLEENAEVANEYFTARDRSCLITPDARTSAWLAADPEFSVQASLISAALVETFSGDVRVSILEDPDGGDEKVLFEVLTKMDGQEARQLMNRFLDENLPEGAKALEDEMIFSVVPIGKSGH